jgi:hypothetical protein
VKFTILNFQKRKKKKGYWKNLQASNPTENLVEPLFQRQSASAACLSHQVSSVQLPFVGALCEQYRSRGHPALSVSTPSGVSTGSAAQWKSKCMWHARQREMTVLKADSVLKDVFFLWASPSTRVLVYVVAKSATVTSHFKNGPLLSCRPSVWKECIKEELKSEEKYFYII